ncbi:MAG TPA: outer membrane lipoprotein carrier protein LolA [Mangrovimonas sp.]|nr:outer membrane lipoprotein carrier protein LolA [Mangrovimonas sp.]
MKKLFTVLAILVSLASFSQNDAKAKALLSEVSAKVKSYNNISIDFKYVLTNLSENINQETRGSVVMQGNKYKLDILGITRIYDGKTLYSISPEDEEVTISKEDGTDPNSITPSKMLSFYEDGFTYQMDILQTIKGRKIQYVKLTPMDSHSEIKQILLGIDAETKHIYNLIETGKNGTRTTLTVNSFKTNEPISPALFTFDESKHKEYYINRLD